MTTNLFAQVAGCTFGTATTVAAHVRIVASSGYCEHDASEGAHTFSVPSARSCSALNDLMPNIVRHHVASGPIADATNLGRAHEHREATDIIAIVGAVTIFALVCALGVT